MNIDKNESYRKGAENIVNKISSGENLFEISKEILNSDSPRDLYFEIKTIVPELKIFDRITEVEIESGKFEKSSNKVIEYKSDFISKNFEKFTGPEIVYLSNCNEKGSVSKRTIEKLGFNGAEKYFNKIGFDVYASKLTDSWKIKSISNDDNTEYTTNIRSQYITENFKEITPSLLMNLIDVNNLKLSVLNKVEESVGKEPLQNKIGLEMYKDIHSKYKSTIFETIKDTLTKDQLPNFDKEITKLAERDPNIDIKVLKEELSNGNIKTMNGFKMYESGYRKNVSGYYTKTYSNENGNDYRVIISREGIKVYDSLSFVHSKEIANEQTINSVVPSIYADISAAARKYEDFTGIKISYDDKIAFHGLGSFEKRNELKPKKFRLSEPKTVEYNSASSFNKFLDSIESRIEKDDDKKIKKLEVIKYARDNPQVFEKAKYWLDDTSLLGNPPSGRIKDGIFFNIVNNTEKRLKGNKSFYEFGNDLTALVNNYSEKFLNGVFKQTDFCHSFKIGSKDYNDLIINTLSKDFGKNKNGAFTFIRDIPLLKNISEISKLDTLESFNLSEGTITLRDVLGKVSSEKISLRQDFDFAETQLINSYETKIDAKNIVLFEENRRKEIISTDKKIYASAIWSCHGTGKGL